MRDVYDEALRQMGFEGLPKPCSFSLEVELLPLEGSAILHRAIIIENPGVGKSFGLLHALRRLLVAGKVVVLEFAHDCRLYAFIPSRMEAPAADVGDYKSDERARQLWRGSDTGLEDYTVYSIESNAIRRSIPMLQCPDTFYLLDPDEYGVFPLAGARTIVATSPDAEKIKNYSKQHSFRLFYVSMYSLKELKRVMKTDVFGEQDEALIEDKFYIAGGNLRAMMSNDVFELLLTTIPRKVSDFPSSTDVVHVCNRNYRMQLDKNIGNSSTIFSYESSYPFLHSNTYVGFVSNYIRHMVVSKFYNDVYKKGVGHADAWEVTCAVALALGGKFEIRRMVYAKPKGATMVVAAARDVVVEENATAVEHMVVEEDVDGEDSEEEEEVEPEEPEAEEEGDVEQTEKCPELTLLPCGPVYKSSIKEGVVTAPISKSSRALGGEAA